MNMAPYTRAFIVVICIVAVAESKTKFSPVPRASTAINAIVNDVLGGGGDTFTTRPPVSIAPARDVHEEPGCSKPGSENRPSPDSMNAGRRNPPAHDVINSLDNMPIHFPKQPSKENPEPVTNASDTTDIVTTIKPERAPQDPDSSLMFPIYLPDPAELSGRQPAYPTPQEPVQPTYPQQSVYPSHNGPSYVPKQPQQPLYPAQPSQQLVYPSAQEPIYPNYRQKPMYPPHQDLVYPPQQPEYGPQQSFQPIYPISQEPVYSTYPQQPQKPIYPPQQTQQPYYPPRQFQPAVPSTPEEPIFPQYPQQPQEPIYRPNNYNLQQPKQPVYPSQEPQQSAYPPREPLQPVYRPQEPQQPVYTPQDPNQPVYPPKRPIEANESCCSNKNYVIPNHPTENKNNHSIIIINLNDLPSQYGGITLMQLLDILKGKPGFVYVMESGGQGKFIPLTHLHLLPENSTPSYIVLLVYGQPNPALNPGLQSINGLLPSGKLGFLTSNFGGLDSLPVYVANNYYAIMSILNSLGNYYPGQDGDFIPTSYPSMIGGLTTPAPIGSAFQSSVNDMNLGTLLQMLGRRSNGNGDINKKPVGSDFDLITLMQLLNMKPGYETEENIYKETKNPANLLRIIIELLGKKLGLNQAVNRSQKENNPSKLLQILIDLMREGNSSGNVAIPHNNESKLIQLLMTFIANQQVSGHISSHDITSQSNLVNVLVQLLNKQPELIQNFAPGAQIDNPANLVEILKKIPNISKGFGGSFLNLGGNSGSSGVDMNKLLQIIQIMLKEQSSNPTIIIQDRRPMTAEESGVNPNIMNMLLESGGGRNIKAGLWSYLRGQQSCVPYEGRRVLCAK